MTIERFSVDESGYTGADLMNAEQRFQGATAISINDEDAAKVIKQYFPKLQAPELKYGALARRAGNRDRLIALQKNVLENHKCVTYLCDKRFLLILMFLNYATEPWYYERGVNFYESGQNYAMASLLAYIAPTMLGENVFDGILGAFQRAVKAKTHGALEELVQRVRQSNWEATLPEASDLSRSPLLSA